MTMARLLPRGEIGNLLVKGETAALCYTAGTPKAARPFAANGCSLAINTTSTLMATTGTPAASDDMLKVGGIWVSPVEVESTLIGHAAVLECAVIGQPDQSDLIKPKAFVTLRATRHPTPWRRS